MTVRDAIRAFYSATKRGEQLKGYLTPITEGGNIMFCAKCQNEMERCICVDASARLRSLSDEGGPMVMRWCTVCDEHYARCQCSNPIWKIRADGELRELAEFGIE